MLHIGKKALIVSGLLIKGWTLEEINSIFGFRPGK